MATIQHKFFCVREFRKNELATAVQRAFRLRFNIQPTENSLACVKAPFTVRIHILNDSYKNIKLMYD